jgi:GDP-mannose transporter
MVSAATYTLVGVVNKFFTVLLNVFLWDKHSSTAGLGAVCVCLAAGFFYQQAPLREEGVVTATRTKGDKDCEPLISKKKKRKNVGVRQ